MENLNNIAETLKAHQEELSQMRSVCQRMHIGYNLIAKKMGAIAWRGNTMSTWATFIMPDLSVKFGHVSSPLIKSECIVDIQYIDLFSNIANKLAFTPCEYRKGIPVKVESIEGYNKTWA